MEMMETMEKRCKRVTPPANGHASNLGVVRAKGSYLYTEDHRKILDFASGVAVNNLGNCHPRVVEAIKKQLDSMIHVGHNVVYNETYVELAEKLVELTGGDTMVYFSNSGAEANEGAIKLAKYVTRRPAVISFRNSFHGRTLGMVSLTGSSAAYRKNYEPLLPSVYWADYANCHRCPFYQKKGQCHRECLKQFETIFQKQVDPSMVAAIFLEPVQGEGGYVVPPVEFLQGLRQICDQYGIFLIFDEVQTGLGRTGALYASQRLGVRPDIFTSAKALGGGIPLSAVIARREIMEQWPAGAHGGTFGGNPLACAAALETLKVIEEEDLLTHCRDMGSLFLEKLQELKDKYPQFIGDVRGLGLMVAMELEHPDGSPDEKITARIKEEALKRDLLLLTCGSDHNVVRFIAPLTVAREEIEEALAILDGTLSEIARETR